MPVVLFTLCFRSKKNLPIKSLPSLGRLSKSPIKGWFQRLVALGKSTLKITFDTSLPFRVQSIRSSIAKTIYTQTMGVFESPETNAIMLLDGRGRGTTTFTLFIKLDNARIRWRVQLKKDPQIKRKLSSQFNKCVKAVTGAT